MIERGKYIGVPMAENISEADHFMKCEACGGWFDCRDLSQVFDHEKALPHPKQDQPQ